jgi:VanZ family protein
VRRSFLTIWGPFLAALAIIFWLSSLSMVPGARYFWDKFLHAFGYAALGILALRAFHGGFTPARLLPTVLAGVAILLWGISDEFHQSFVPGRDASVLDLFADMIGFLLAVAVFRALTLRALRLDRSR